MIDLSRKICVASFKSATRRIQKPSFLIVPVISRTMKRTLKDSFKLQPALASKAKLREPQLRRINHYSPAQILELNMMTQHGTN